MGQQDCSPEMMLMETTVAPEGALGGQVAIVTGSAQGIGAGIAQKFASHGARVVVHGLSRHTQSAEMVSNNIREAGGECFIFTGDLREETHCRDLVRFTFDNLGQLDILVNNAAGVHRGNIETTTVALWDEIFSTNLRSVFILCQESVKYMKRSQRGCIINIGSVLAHVGMGKLLAYSASKGGMMTFTKNLANYLTRYRIRVNQINPGWTLTDGEHYVQSIVEGKGESWLDEAVKTRPFGRMLLPSDLADAALFLATNELITGAILDYEQVVFDAMPD
jgi:NAD(P)-dependent dehydrogenase (short-subunit alcohol dehydrogenase family)